MDVSVQNAASVPKVCRNASVIKTESLEEDFDNDSKHNFYLRGDGKTCRLCLCDGANFKIFTEDLAMVDKILRCCEIEVFEEDGLPDHVCSDCCNTLEIATNFKIKSQESDRILKDFKCNVKVEYLSDDGFNNNFDEAYDSFEEKKPKKRKARTLKEIAENQHKTKRKSLKKIKVKSELDEDVKLEFECESKTLKRNRKAISKSTLCPFCGKTFKKLSSLNSHIKTHKTERPFTCDICSKTFFEKWHLHEHKKTHSDVKSYPCEACGKLFKSPRDTKRHTDTVHKKIRSVQCKLCCKYLSSNSGLKLHMKSHTGEKEFQCDICNRKFISKPCLTLHRRVHTGEKPYSCKFCDGRFAILKTLKEHERIHTGVTPYSCPVCKKGFSQKSNMKSHFRYNHRGMELAQEIKNNESSNHRGDELIVDSKINSEILNDDKDIKYESKCFT